MRDRRLKNESTRDFSVRIADRSSDLPLDRSTGLIDFNKIRVGTQILQDAIIDTPIKRVNAEYGSKDFVLRCIDRDDIPTIRRISDFYYRSSGIYSRLCRYMAYLYRYD